MSKNIYETAAWDVFKVLCAMADENGNINPPKWSSFTTFFPILYGSHGVNFFTQAPKLLKAGLLVKKSGYRCYPAKYWVDVSAMPAMYMGQDNASSHARCRWVLRQAFGMLQEQTYVNLDQLSALTGCSSGFIQEMFEHYGIGHLLKPPENTPRTEPAAEEPAAETEKVEVEGAAEMEDSPDDCVLDLLERLLGSWQRGNKDAPRLAAETYRALTA